MELREAAFESSTLAQGKLVENRKDKLTAARFRWLAATIVMLAAIMFFARLGGRSLWSSEGRWAEVAREMTVAGDYFWPTINGHVYYDKPLLSYWLVAAASKLAGVSKETAVRLPSACAGLIAVALTLLIARRLYGDETALFAALILATSFSFVFFSRHASADMETVAGELGTLALFLSNRTRPALSWLVPFWLLMALTSLTKGLLGFALPLLIAFCYSSLADGWRDLLSEVANAPSYGVLAVLSRRNRWFFSRATLPAALFAAAVYLLPFLVSYLRTGSNLGLYMVFRENILRFVHPFDHRGPVLLYIPVIFALLAPWSAFLPGALIYVHQTLKASKSSSLGCADRFTLTFFWATFIFFTASGSRRSYYILPILPAGAMLVARALNARPDTLSALARHTLDAGYFVVAGAAILGIVALASPWFLPGRLASLPSLPHPHVFLAMWLVATCAVIYAHLRPSPRARLAAASTIAYLAFAYVFVVAMPAVERYRGERQFARAVTTRLRAAPAPLVLYRIWGPGLVFYLGFTRPIPQFDDPAALTEYLARGNTQWIITRAQDLSALKIPFTIVEREASYPWEPVQRAQGKYLLLRLNRN
jgi:4-amino-4-deoxy-L-arabinose transferase-like glycosyltransferase